MRFTVLLIKHLICHFKFCFCSWFNVSTRVWEIINCSCRKLFTFLFIQVHRLDVQFVKLISVLLHYAHNFKGWELWFIVHEFKCQQFFLKFHNNDNILCMTSQRSLSRTHIFLLSTFVNRFQFSIVPTKKEREGSHGNRRSISSPYNNELNAFSEKDIAAQPSLFYSTIKQKIDHVLWKELPLMPGRWFYCKIDFQNL